MTSSPTFYYTYLCNDFMLFSRTHIGFVTKRFRVGIFTPYTPTYMAHFYNFLHTPHKLRHYVVVFGCISSIMAYLKDKLLWLYSSKGATVSLRQYPDIENCIYGALMPMHIYVHYGLLNKYHFYYWLLDNLCIWDFHNPKI